MKFSKTLTTGACVAAVLAATPAFAFKEYPAGEAVTMNEMEIAAVYLQPIDMEPRGMGLPAAKADVHLEADISATDGNKNGFGKGEWIPYLTINYTLVNKDTGDKQSGTFMPMVASDGPHYGANVKMAGVGNYTVTYQIEPPPKAGMHRHTDKESGVARWWKPFEVENVGTIIWQFAVVLLIGVALNKMWNKRIAKGPMSEDNENTEHLSEQKEV